MPRRSGSACRYQVNSFLRKRYATLEEAEDDLQVNYFSGGLQDIHYENSSTLTSPGNVNSTPQAMLEKNTPLSPILAHSPHANSTNHETYNHGDTIAKFMFLELDHDFRAFIPSDFIKLCCKGINVLHSNGKENVLYYLARGLGMSRKDGSGPRLPIDKMPFGLLSYNIRYFAMDTVNNISSDPHFVEWETTMFSNFGHKWICLQRGPGFAYDETVVDDSSAAACNSTSNTNSSEQGSSSILQQAWNETFQVSTQNGVQDEVEDQDTTREKVGADDCLDVETLVDTDDPLEVGAIVQTGDGIEVETVVEAGDPLEVAVLKKIKERNKNGRWWIKADACDLRKGLRESMRHEWAGDCDLGDGKLQTLYQEYMDRKTFYGGLGLKDQE
ncbi:unnamed protein product [Porites lobata]|uniref:Uncharacterized protein n=1 Tax=Porites lobata TaxID=104759 RepID=A0ABN8QGY8_9CNID|nr:unnamed protein product [Porites lobata]